MDDVTAWQRGELVLQKMTLTDIINVLERKYPYAFVYSIKNLKKRQVQFSFQGQRTTRRSDGNHRERGRTNGL